MLTPGATDTDRNALAILSLVTKKNRLKSRNVIPDELFCTFLT
jgi:hypothetical protein